MKNARFQDLRELMSLKQEVASIFKGGDLETLATANATGELPDGVSHLIASPGGPEGGLDLWQYLDFLYEYGADSDDIARIIERIRSERLRRIERIAAACEEEKGKHAGDYSETIARIAKRFKATQLEVEDAWLWALEEGER